MKVTNNQKIIIQSYKHDGSLHRTFFNGKVVKTPEGTSVFMHKNIVISKNRRWINNDPAICVFYPDRWYNVIVMFRPSGIRYYCNIASPSLYDGEAIKHIDYDLDIKINEQFKITLIDYFEYLEHLKKYNYSQKLQSAIYSGLQQLLSHIHQKVFPFNTEEILTIYQSIDKDGYYENN